MKIFTPEISWHNRLPALALDISEPIQDAPDTYRVATGGNDCRVYIWMVDIKPKGKLAQNGPDIRIRAGLRRHQKSVGAVRFSSQHVLATGDDDGYIYLWRHKENYDSDKNMSTDSDAFLNDDGFEDLELWQQQRVLRGHIEDICDLAWSKDGQFLLSGSVDNSAILWDTLKGTKIWCSDLIKGYVQGVAVDPHSQFLAAISSDRTLRVYNFNDKRLINATRRMNIQGKYKAFFCDDTVQTFCRRFEFSPDGQYLLVPTSRMIEKEQKPFNVLLLFKRNSFNKPTNYYPFGREPALCVRFCPVVFKLRPNNNSNFWDIPYRIVFAVATSRSLIIYDSQQATPIAYASQIHLARLTDLAWSSDGRLLMVTSYDGYSTLLTFDQEEFGEIYDQPLLEPVAKSTNGAANINKQQVGAESSDQAEIVGSTDTTPTKKTSGANRIKPMPVKTPPAKEEKPAESILRFLVKKQ